MMTNSTVDGELYSDQLEKVNVCPNISTPEGTLSTCHRFSKSPLSTALFQFIDYIETTPSCVIIIVGI